MAGSTLVLSPSLTRAPHEKSRALSIGRGIGPADDEIQILLATPSLDRPYVPLRVFTTDSIQSVKMQVARSHGFNLSSQVSGIRLVSGGRELRAREHADLAGYGISKSGEVLHLALRLSDLVDVRVQTRDGVEKTFTLEKGARVWDLKQKIAKDKQALDAEDAQLVLRGRPLQEGLLVEDLALSRDAVIHLLVQKSSKVRVKQGKGQHVELTIESSRQLPLAAKGISQKKRLPSIEPSLCISPLGSLSNSRDRDSLFHMIAKATAGLPVHPPVLSLGGMGAAYFLADRSGETCCVFKPMDEEPLAVNNPRGLPVSKTGEGLKRGTRVGEGAAREVAAFLLDKDGFASVPPTAMVSCTHPSFHFSHKQTSLLCEEGACNRKVGSLQQFVPCVSNCEDTGPQSLPVAEVHKISVLDIRLANADRSGENILVCRKEDGSTKLVPIDHGYCLPESMEDVWFDWIYWPQSKVPYSAEVKAYIANLDVEEDLSLLAANGIHLSEKAERVLQASTLLLKKGVARGLTAHDIASLMCRMDLNKESALEGMLSQAEEALLPGCSLEAFVEVLGIIMDKALEG